LIQEADGDTLFLDEVGDMPLPLQARLLSVLDERELLPVGATKADRVVARGPAAAVPARRALESDPDGAPARPVAHDGLPGHEALGPAGAREVPAWISRECRAG
jgi:hypothetical protein